MRSLIFAALALSAAASTPLAAHHPGGALQLRGGYDGGGGYGGGGYGGALPAVPTCARRANSDPPTPAPRAGELLPRIAARHADYMCTISRG